MRSNRRSILATVLVCMLSPGCTLSEHYAFRTETGTRGQAAYPPGVRVATYLDGVYEEPREGVPLQLYELRIDIEQDDPASPWRPDFSHAELRDDEDHRIPISAWFTDAAKSKPPGLERYRVVFEMNRPYRFASILAATVRWRLTAPGRSDHPVVSRFRR